MDSRTEYRPRSSGDINKGVIGIESLNHSVFDSLELVRHSKCAVEFVGSILFFKGHKMFGGAVTNTILKNVLNIHLFVRCRSVQVYN